MHNHTRNQSNDQQSSPITSVPAATRPASARARVRVLIAAAGLLSIASPVVASDAIDRAVELLGSGKVVEAREVLSELSRSDLSLSQVERARVSGLATQAMARLRALSAEEVSLQTSELRVETGDLRLAQAQASSVIESPKATNEQTARARAVLARVTEEQATLAPQVDELVRKALALAQEGKASEAKASVARVVTSGLSLNADQQALVEQVQGMVLESPVTTSPVALGMLQPGVVRRPTEPAPEQPAQPPAAPAPQPIEYIEPAQPLQPAQPVPQPVWEPQPVAVAMMQPMQPPASDPVAAARSWESQALLAEADAAFIENRMGEASTKYARLLDQYADLLAPDARTRAEQRLVESRIRLGGNPGQQGGILEQTIQNNTAARQATLAEFENDLLQSRAALSSGDTQRARDLAAQARVRMSSGRNLFSEDELRGYRAQVDGVLSEIDATEARLRDENIARQQEANRLAAENAALAQAQDKSRKLNEAVDRVRALQEEQKYEEALQVVEGQILFLDPINPTGLLLRDVLRDTITFKKWSSIQSERVRSYDVQSVENHAAMIAPDRILDYPKDWPAISDRRGTPIAFAEAEENRRALSLLQSKRVPVAFDETPLERVVEFLAAVTQLNIDVDWPSLEQAGIARDKSITLKLTNVPLETVLNRVVEKASGDSFGGAGWTITDGVLTVASKEVINRQRVLVIYDIRDLIIEVPDYADAPTFDLQQAFQQARGGRGGGGGGGQSPFQQTGGNERQERRTLEERTDDLLEIIRAQVDPEGWDSGVGTIQTLGGLLIINNTPANHRSINGLLGKLRETRAMQINVETRFLLVSQDFFEQIGFDLDVYLNANSNVVRTARATRPTTRPSDFFNFQSGGYQPTFPQPPSANANTNVTGLGDPWSPIGGGQNSLGLAESLLQTDFSQDVFSTSPALGIAGQFLDDIQVDFLIKATQADRRTVSLTAPRLTFTNGQVSNITVGTQVQFVADLEPVVSESAVGFDPDPQPINEGVTLLVDGTISADRRYVTLNIDTGVSRIESIQPLAVSAIAGGQLVNSAATQSFIQLPTVTVTRVQTTVTVPDQGTILIGGQRLSTDAEVETGVPVLSKIPILNRFFTNRILSKEDSTLMILLKPTILIQSEEEQLNFPGVQDSLVMPFGR